MRVLNTVNIHHNDILANAREVFTNRGFYNTDILDIAHKWYKGYIPNSNVYSFFNTKPELFKVCTKSVYTGLEDESLSDVLKLRFEVETELFRRGVL